MKVSKRGSDKFRNYELRIILPRININNFRSPKDGFKKRKRGRPSNKENEILRNACSSLLPKLHLIKIDEARSLNWPENRSQKQNLKNDRRLPQISNSDINSYTKVDKIRIENSTTERDGVISSSSSVHVSRSSNEAECNTVQTATSSRPTRSKRRVLEDLRNVSSTRNLKEHNLSETTAHCDNEPTKNDRAMLQTSEIHNQDEVDSIIQAHFSHRCQDKVDEKINDVRVHQTPDGTFVRKDFTIRIQQCCAMQPSTSTVTERTTSVVSSATKRENIVRNSEKTRRNITVEKTIGINLRTNTKSTEKSCTKIVHSKFTEIVESRNKQANLKSSEIITRRRAASGTECKFYSLPYYTNALPTIEENSILGGNISLPVKPTNKPHVSRKTTGSNKHYNDECPSYSKAADSSKKKQILKEVTAHRSKKSKNKASRNSRNSQSSRLKTSDEIVKIDLTENPTPPRLRNRTSHRKSNNSADLTTTALPINTKQLKKRNEVRSDQRDTNEQQNRDTLTVKSNVHDDIRGQTRAQIAKKRLRNKSPLIDSSSDDENLSLLQLKRNCSKHNPAISKKKFMKKKASEKKNRKSNEKCEISKRGTISERTRSKTCEESFSNGSTTQNLSKADDAAVAGTSRCPLNVTFAESTPDVIPQTKKNKYLRNYTPSIVLDKLDASNISTYAITPLREERVPLPSKTSEDYGIDDVNTDDSTDDEENPKKVIPAWVKEIRAQAEVQFYIPRESIQKWMRPPKKFTKKSLFSHSLSR